MKQYGDYLFPEHIRDIAEAFVKYTNGPWASSILITTSLSSTLCLNISILIRQQTQLGL